MFSHGQEFTWTSIDVNEEYIAVGTNVGQLFLYDRSKGVIRHQLPSQVHVNLSHQSILYFSVEQNVTEYM